MVEYINNKVTFGPYKVTGFLHLEILKASQHMLKMFLIEKRRMGESFPSS